MEELSLPEFENYPDILSRIQDAITTGISIEHAAIIVKDINTLYNLILQSNPEAKLTGRYNKTHTEKRADRITIPNNNGIFYIEKNADGSTIGMSVNSKAASLEREVRHIAEIDSHGYERHLSFSRSSKVGRDSTLIRQEVCTLRI